MARALRARQDARMPGSSDPRPSRRRRARWLGLLLLPAFALVVMPADWLTAQYFYPTRAHVLCPEDEGREYVAVGIPAAGGADLDGWWFPGRGAQPRRGIVVHAHGNAGNLSHHWMLSVGLADRGFDVLCFDYRGFGRSPGQASRRRALDDLRSAMTFARVRARAEGLPVFVLGQSMGAALALELLGEEPLAAALVADSPFASWAGIASHHLGGGHWWAGGLELLLRLTVGRTGTDPVDAAVQLDGLPVLVIAGTEDRVCPAHMALAVHDAAGDSSRLLLLDGAPHVGQRSEVHAERALDEAAAFFAAVARGPSRDPVQPR